ncbi:GIY-YIG nuclease family protein [Salmonella enterica]|nr:GIY-YIG nuclease family protein [Salmonella enterica]
MSTRTGSHHRKINTMKYVYVMQSASGLVKIGVSKNVSQRRKHLENQSGVSVEVIATFGPFNAASRLERTAHDLFSQDRESGEWFAIKAKDAVDAINKITSTFEDSASHEKEGYGTSISAAERHLLCIDDAELITNTVTYLRENSMLDEGERLNRLFMAGSLTTRDFLYECQMSIMERKFYDLLEIHNDLKSKVQMYLPGIV